MRLARTVRGSVMVTLLALVSLGGMQAARADEQSDLDKGRVAYQGRRYDEADARFRAMLDPTNGTLHDATLVSRARMYWGATLYAKGEAASATAIFEKILLDDPTFEPDPLSFPTDVVGSFIDTRSRMRERLSALAAEAARREAEERAREEADRKRQAEHLALVEKLATEEKITDRHSRWVAALPLGVGQFQNGDKALGWAFLGTETALIVGAAIAVPIYETQLKNAFNKFSSSDTVEASQYFDRASQARTVNIVLLSVGLGIAAAGIIEAEAAYKPDIVEIRHRVIPPSSGFTWAPSLAPSFGEGRMTGGSAGISGRF